MSERVLRSPWLRVAIMLVALIGAGVALWWHGPSWAVVSDAFSAVRWRWIFVAIGLNLLSVLARSLAWRTVINQAVEPPQPPYRLVFAAFSVGLFANAVLPGRIGELARVAVLTRRMPGRRGIWATLVGTVFAHRLFDIVPVLALIVYVLFTAKIPRWAETSLTIFVIVAVGLFGMRGYVANFLAFRGFDPPREPAFVTQPGTTVRLSPGRFRSVPFAPHAPSLWAKTSAGPDPSNTESSAFTKRPFMLFIF